LYVSRELRALETGENLGERPARFAFTLQINPPHPGLPATPEEQVTARDRKSAFGSPKIFRIAERVSLPSSRGAAIGVTAARAVALQHLPNDDVRSILLKSEAFRYAIFVNDVSGHVRGTWKNLRRWTPTPSPAPNSDIPAGGYRQLRLREAPFHLQAKHLLTYKNEYRGERWSKEVLLVVNEERSTS